MPRTFTVPSPVARFDLSRTVVFREILTMSLDSLRADKLRAAMTALGDGGGHGRSDPGGDDRADGQALCAGADRSGRDERDLGRVLRRNQRLRQRRRRRLPDHQRHDRRRAAGARHQGSVAGAQHAPAHGGWRRKRARDSGPRGQRSIPAGAAHLRERRTILRSSGFPVGQQGSAGHRKPGAQPVRHAGCGARSDGQDPGSALRHHRHFPRERRYHGPLRN